MAMTKAQPAKPDSETVHTTSTPVDKPADSTQQPTETGAPAGDDVNRADGDQVGTHLYVVVSTLSNGQQHSEIVAAESKDGLKERAVHAGGAAEDDVQIFELRTV